MKLSLIQSKDGQMWLIPNSHYETVYKVMSKDICKYYLEACGECGHFTLPTCGEYCIGPSCHYKRIDKSNRRRGRSAKKITSEK